MAETSSEIFELLQHAAPQPNEFITRESGLTFHKRPVQLAVDAHERPALLVPLGEGDPTIFDAASKGIRLETFAVQEKPGEFRQLIVRCEDTSLRPQFGYLIDDMLSTLRRDGGKDAGTTCLSVLDRWRHLFETAKGTLLGVEAQIGLLAELHVLEALQLRGGPAALDMWHGPDAKRHDFVALTGSVEVKATLAREGFPITIHGAQQLDQPASGTLNVYAEQYEETPSGDSVADAVGRIIANGIDVHAFVDKLSGVGFQLSDSPTYSAYRFATTRRRICLVDDQFPRISKSTVNDPSMLDRITRVQYSLDIGMLSSTVPDDAALEQATTLLSNDIS